MNFAFSVVFEIKKKKKKKKQLISSHLLYVCWAVGLCF